MTLLRQDVAIMRATQAGHTRTLRDRLHDVRIMRAAMSDMAKDNVMPAEVEVLHQDVTTLHCKSQK
jgi:hypothetical protein